MDTNYLRFSLTSGQRPNPETEEPIASLFPQRDDQGSFDKFNQHMLLTAQAVNRLYSQFTVRGA
jgi:hypothetical protein